jgi:hypothetical protein
MIDEREVFACWWRDLLAGFGGGVGEATRRELEEANSGGIGRRIWWRDLVEENGGGIGGRIGRSRGECLGDTTIEFSPTFWQRTLSSDDAHRCGESNERKESGA